MREAKQSWACKDAAGPILESGTDKEELTPVRV